MLLGTFIINSCVMDYVSSYCIKNCSVDTLYIELTTSDSLDNWLYWNRLEEKDKRPITYSDTTCVNIKGEDVILDNIFYALPDSIILANPYLFDVKDTCFIYAVKFSNMKRYLLDDIRKNKLYNRRVVTKKDFVNRMYEYK